MSHSNHDHRSASQVPPGAGVDGLEDLLRREARTLRDRAPEGLSARVMSNLGPAPGPPASLPAGRAPWRAFAAAALVLLAGLVGTTLVLRGGSRVDPVDPTPRVAAARRAPLPTLRSLIDGVADPLIAMAPEPSPLEDEADRLWRDTTSVARVSCAGFRGPCGLR